MATIDKKKSNAKASKNRKKTVSKKTTKSSVKPRSGVKTKANKAKSLSSAGLSASRKKEIDQLFASQKEFFPQVKASDAKMRIEKLKALLNAMNASRGQLEEALFADFQKSGFETDLTEFMPAVAEIKEAISHVKGWMKPKRVGTPLLLAGASSKLLYEPKGVCLIIAPWNYPFYLTVAPLIAAVAAGNCVIIKPSEYTPNTGRYLKQMLASVFNETEVAVVEGDYTIAGALGSMPFNHIFFTGSTAVGKKVMEAAAPNLASVTLELGGKSPVIVDENCNIELAAKRIMWGKVVNAGQTCVAPDYVYVHESRKQEFADLSRKYLLEYLGAEPIRNANFCSIIDNRHFARVNELVADAMKKGANVVVGGTSSSSDRKIEPTVVFDVNEKMSLMQEEIFGPVLPVIPYNDVNEAIAFINKREKPLALYIFSKDNKFINDVIAKTSSGGTCVNDVILHLANSSLPFGGVNHSGIGSYHGHFGFKAFSHERAYMKQPGFTGASLMYPPYTNFKQKLVDLTTKYFT